MATPGSPDVLRRRRRGGLAALAAVGGLLLPIPLASPAEAAWACGGRQTVRVSINYLGCAQPSGSTIIGHPEWGNNHGSAVDIEYRTGWRVNGTVNMSNTVHRKRIPTGWSSGPTVTGTCRSRNQMNFGQQVKTNSGSWGATAWSPTFTCP